MKGLHFIPKLPSLPRSRKIGRGACQVMRLTVFFLVLRGRVPTSVSDFLINVALSYFPPHFLLSLSLTLTLFFSRNLLHHCNISYGISQNINKTKVTMEYKWL